MRRPEQTIAYRVYRNGVDLLGIAQVEMPQVQYITETIGGSGVAGEYDSPALGMTQSMTAKFTWVSQTQQFFSLLDSSEQLLLECYASVQQVDETTGVRVAKPLKVTVLGQVKSSPLGSLETGKKHGNETEVEALRLQVELDGDEMLLVDKLNFIHRVNGKDNLAVVREHLGLEF